MQNGRKATQSSYSSRTLETFVKLASSQFPVLLLTGARQVGKTTLLRRVGSEERVQVTLDDPLVLTLAREDPALFFQRFRPPLLIDEIQYAPGLLPYIKMAADSQGEPGMFWLTGSQQFQMMQGVSESLAGRVAVLQLLGLSHRELLGEGQTAPPFLPFSDRILERMASEKGLDASQLFHLIWRGSFPALALHEGTNRDLFYGSYVATYLQRDVRDLAHVGDEMAFLRFMRACAARTAQILNLASLARDADVAPNTAKNWLSILQSSGIVYLLEPYHTNLSSRLVKRPKLYFLDTGLSAYLTEWTTPQTLEAGAMAGAILETWVVAELLKSYWHAGRRAPFYYYRDRDQTEIDILILADGTIYPVEIKKTASPRADHAGQFRTLAKLGLPVGPGGVICLADRSLPLAPGVVSIPASLL